MNKHLLPAKLAVADGLWNNEAFECLKGFSGAMVDNDGYRPNVGIVLANSGGQLLWAKRVGQDAWQFPQGGINADESPRQAMLRELREEVGLLSHQVEVVSCTEGWMHYRLPERMVRRNREPLCIGQKQKWFLLRMLAADREVSFDHNERPEFDHWRWVSYWYPLGQVIFFKREVYRRALLELAPRLHGGYSGSRDRYA